MLLHYDLVHVSINSCKWKYSNSLFKVFEFPSSLCSVFFHLQSTKKLLSVQSVQADRAPKARMMYCSTTWSIHVFIVQSIKTRSSMTHQKRVCDYRPPRVCSLQEQPLWSWAFSRRTPCCSGNLVETRWQPAVNKSNILACKSAIWGHFNLLIEKL